jgi:hypothetical protein
LIAEEERIVLVPAVMGYIYRSPESLLTREGGSLSEEMRALVRRMFAQTGTREWDSVQVGDVYHPAVGFIDHQ